MTGWDARRAIAAAIVLGCGWVAFGMPGIALGVAVIAFYSRDPRP